MISHIRLAERIRSGIGSVQPRIALVLGSGLSTVADIIEQPRIFAYDELEGFGRSTVPGHTGRLLIGNINGIGVACMQGRHHAYEGHPPAALALPIRCLNALGCHTVILTNAAGSLRTDLQAGELLVISDHINWAGVNPLMGPNDESIGPRFVDMGDAWCAELRGRFHRVAREEAIELKEGVYLMAPGPNFETPAEVRAMAILGGDAVGMSTVPECLVARHCGMRVLGLSLISNLGAGLADEQKLDHEGTLAAGADASSRVARLLNAFLQTSNRDSLNF
ncbi:MAG: purine-nucleoside phosphorylase [Granulosicoccus sp.]|nr:purine-nucleoside phosphorylase [Granulosicoccus sp.]